METEAADTDFDTESDGEPISDQDYESSEEVSPVQTVEPAASSIPRLNESDSSREGLPETEAVREQILTMRIGDREVAVEWEGNESVEALKELVADTPLTVQMSMYGGFEQVGDLGTSLPRNDVQTTTQTGDIVLYSGDSIVVFYGSNSWAYTRLGRIQDMTEEELSSILSSGDVVVTLEMK